MLKYCNVSWKIFFIFCKISIESLPKSLHKFVYKLLNLKIFQNFLKVFQFFKISSIILKFSSKISPKFVWSLSKIVYTMIL